jgi:hypothetical protein
MSFNASRKLDAACLTVLFATALTACGELERTDTRESEEATTTTTTQALSASGLTLSGSASQEPLSANNFAFAHLFGGAFRLTNNTNKTVTVDKQSFYFAAPGGFVWAPSLDIWWPDPLSAGASAEGGGGWIWSAPVAHLVMRVDGRTSTGTRVAGIGGLPILAPGFASPGPSPVVDDVNVGVQGPVEIVRLTSGERWMELVGSVVDTTQTATADPAITIQARNASGGTVATLAKSFGPYEGLPWHRTFIAWTALPQNASVANIRATASQGIFNGTASQTRTIPVVNVTPASIVSPVAGADWLWNNGPGQTFWHVHTGAPEARYAYDICVFRMVNGQLQSHSGDPGVNSNYFCWDQPIRAAMTGTVVSVVDSVQDNNGNTHDHDQGINNEIIIQHPNNVFTRYAHMRQGTATVTVGQTVYAGSVIALLGNAGASDGPHLHFHAFKIDSTGRQAAVAFTVPGMKSASGANVTGVPKGGLIYQTP